jgi:hypothetical protein
MERQMALTDTLPTQSRSGGLIARHLDGTGMIWAAIAVILSAVVAGVASFGIAFLAMSALTAVPVMFVVLLLITRG